MASGPIVGGDDGAKEKPKHKVYTRKVFKDRKKDPNALNTAAAATATAKKDDAAAAKNEDTATTIATTTAKNDNNATAINDDTAAATTTATTTAKNDDTTATTTTATTTAKIDDTGTITTTATTTPKNDDTGTATTTATTTAKNDDTATVTTIAPTAAKIDDNATTTTKTEDTATAKNNDTATATAKHGDTTTTTATTTAIPSASETATATPSATANATTTTTSATATNTATTSITLPATATPTPSVTTRTTPVETTTATKSIDDSNNNSSIKSSDTDEPKGESNGISEEPLPQPGAVPEDGNSILLQVSPRLEDGSSSQPQEKSRIEDGGSALHQENSRLKDGVSAMQLENSILGDESYALVQENSRLEVGESAQLHAASRLEDENLAQPQVSSRLEDKDLSRDQPQGSSRLEDENMAQPQASSRMEDDDLTQNQPQGSSRLDIEISAQLQVSSRLEDEDLAQDQPHASSRLDPEISAQPQTSSRLEDENLALPQMESRLGVGKSAQPPVVMLSDDSCSHQQEEPSTSLNVTQNLPLRNKTMERGLEDRIKISLSSKSKQERQELRWKLESELDVVRNLVKRIELKQGQAGAYGQLNILVGDGINNSSGMKRSLSEVVSAGVPRGSARPLHQLSLSMLENSQGVSESVEKEKRTPKANQFYRNSEFFLAKDKFPPAESNKKSKLSLKRQGGGEMGQGLAMGSKFFKSCSSLLEKLMKHKHAWVFNAPVEVEGLGLHDYYSIITHPMDLGTVKSRLNKNWYKSPKEFAEDVRLTFHNAMTYNPKGQDVHLMAEQLLKIFEDRWAIIESDYNREMRYVIDYGAAPPVPSPLSRKVPTFPPPPLDMRRILDRSESLNHTPRLMTITPSNRTPAPKKPKAKDPNKRDMTFDEKQKLSTNLQSLPSEKLDAIVQIIKKRNSALSQHDDEIEVDIDSVDAETLWELDRFVTNYKKSLSKNKRKLELAQARAEAARNALQKSQAPVMVEVPRETQADERNVPPSLSVQGGNQAGNGSRSSSSSSSSSDSGSSSSDSDSDSSSASGSDAGSQGT